VFPADLVHHTRMPLGHFAAREQPDPLADEIGAFTHVSARGTGGARAGELRADLTPRT
jgi:hypothetical protein